MKLSLFTVGKDQGGFVKEAVQEYCQRISRFHTFEYDVIPDIKKMKVQNTELIKEAEAKNIIKAIPKNAYIVLLDEKGKSFGSMEFATHLEKTFLKSYTQLAFLIGGAYGFHGTIYDIAQERLSLSKMTFSHQLARIFFLEQLYRAFTIMNNMPYHNE